MVSKNIITRKNDDRRKDLTRYSEDPFWQIRNRMNRYFNSIWDEPFGMTDFQNSDVFSPNIDLSETEKEYRVVVDLPGLEEKDIELTFDRNVLSISGQKEAEKVDKDRRYHRIERYSGQFRREIVLNEDVDETKIEATFKNGVLKVNLPKMLDSIQKKKKILISNK